MVTAAIAVVTCIAYGVCYARILRRIAGEAKRPAVLGGRVFPFGGGPDRAVLTFTLKTLARATHSRMLIDF